MTLDDIEKQNQIAQILEKDVTTIQKLSTELARWTRDNAVEKRIDPLVSITAQLISSALGYRIALRMSREDFITLANAAWDNAEKD